MVDSDAQLVFVDAEITGQQFPAKGDRIGFEIIAKAEIAQHFEKRMVACRVADIVQIIVLAARPHAFLR